MGRTGVIAPVRVYGPNDLAAYDGPLLLDTSVWLRYVHGSGDRLCPGTVDLLNRIAQTNQLLVCDISCWEVATKAAKGKLPLAVDVGIWLEQAEALAGFRFRPLTRQVLLQSTRLPGDLRGDPADRMLMALALIDRVPLVTTDRLIIEYAKQHPGLHVVDVR